MYPRVDGEYDDSYSDLLRASESSEMFVRQEQRILELLRENVKLKECGVVASSV